MGGKLWKIAVAAATAIAAAAAAIRVLRRHYGFEKESTLKVLEEWSMWLGPWAIPAYVAAHTLTLFLCLPYAVFFEAGASFLFGFFPAVLCVFAAKILGASLSFSVGRFDLNTLIPTDQFRSPLGHLKHASRSLFREILVALGGAVALAELTSQGSKE